MTSWQDLVFTFGSIVLFASLVPTALGKEKPPVLTSLPTGALLILFAIAYASLGLTASAISTVPTGLLWIVIGGQGIAARRRLAPGARRERGRSKDR
ncbi:MAG: hypothetical protein C0506_08325 [Anaerolinea sp.]|nr:hypothetical protein [Anaerolinea sp.]